MDSYSLSKRTRHDAYLKSNDEGTKIDEGPLDLRIRTEIVLSLPFQNAGLSLSSSHSHPYPLFCIPPRSGIDSFPRSSCAFVFFASNLVKEFFGPLPVLLSRESAVGSAKSRVRLISGILLNSSKTAPTIITNCKASSLHHTFCCGFSWF